MALPPKHNKEKLAFFTCQILVFLVVNIFHYLLQDSTEAGATTAQKGEVFACSAEAISNPSPLLAIAPHETKFASK